MQTGYFLTAWNDIKNSPRWVAKLLLLALVACIPVFGWIVVAGYAYGWARDISWNVHAPLPERIFGNEDGKLYSRGFFVAVIAVVFSLVPVVIAVLGSIVGVGPFFIWGGHHSWPLGMFSVLIGLLFFVVTVALAFCMQLFTWIGCMRMSIYGRLSAGFQLEKLWLMIRRDSTGLLRIFGMSLVLGLAVGVAGSLLSTVVSVLATMVGFVAVGVGSVSMSGAVPFVGATLVLGVVALLLGIASGYVTMVLSMFSLLMVTRALGYWTRQFDVPAWRGQDDPLPFEGRTAQI